MRFAALLVVGCLLAVGSLGADEPLAIRVSPTYAFAPATIVVRSRVASHPDNRSIRISAESGAFYRSSEVELEGENAPTSSYCEFRELPSGAYRVTVTLFDASGRARAVARERVDLISPR